MKQPKKLSRKEKEAVSVSGLNPENWMKVKDVSESYIQVVNKRTGKMRTIDRYAKNGGKA